MIGRIVTGQSMSRRIVAAIDAYVEEQGVDIAALGRHCKAIDRLTRVSSSR